MPEGIMIAGQRKCHSGNTVNQLRQFQSRFSSFDRPRFVRGVQNGARRTFIDAPKCETHFEGRGVGSAQQAYLLA
jgi:hypothetical protein